ncbi:MULTISPECIES: YjbF family lipoprotein [unclassified Paracoccus (in: a-proteobacteria)]|uniref:YjbF family lipoprotein n=1 Tax=unclassified Paracoccus (in: a-proteobacteria) TaxID=2688777 RepID=UPI0012B3C05A|nr:MULTISPECIES: YjbF family lipoprotein [unclassified Paracoccus (in: a-proteobacteria)]UXU75002.1 YjbF family lipoprotein [Paracoccus sp. SMMA_5]UXU80905.1 YjbF family lipoprotein [Paracoccus sp. SMMA_5_TC]
MSFHRIQAAALSVALIAGLAACGNDDSGNASNPLMIAAKTAVGTAARIRGAEDQPAAPARTPEQMAAEALRVNPGPLVLVGFESLGRNQVMAMTGENGGMRTYMAPSKEALILRGGMLVGTRGLGHDLSVAEPQTEALIRAGRSGSASRVMRYYSGDGLERPLKFDCTVGPGPKPGVVIESCQGHGVSFQNSYLPQGGTLAVSRQWVGPNLGYVTIQVLR